VRSVALRSRCRLAAMAVLAVAALGLTAAEGTQAAATTLGSPPGPVPAQVGVPSFTSQASASAVVGTPFSFVISTTGSPTATLTQTGFLPQGIVFDPNANADGTAKLSGTPAAGTGATYKITLSATNSAGSATQSFLLVVDQAPAITSVASDAATVGKRLKFTVRTTGYPVATAAESGALPPGLSFVDESKGTALISGTPAAGSGGTYAIAISATNGVGTPATQSFMITFDQAPAFTSAAMATATIPNPFTFTIDTTGFPAAKLTEVGTLPPGFAFTSYGNGTATISGVPATSPGGSFRISLKAWNASGSVTQGFLLVVDEAPAITTTASETAVVGKHFKFTVKTIAYPTATVTETGSLPSGLTFTAEAHGTATISGTPAAGTEAEYFIPISATNGVGDPAMQILMLTVDS
jgi:large repetitive protein